MNIELSSVLLPSKKFKGVLKIVLTKLTNIWRFLLKFALKALLSFKTPWKENSGPKTVTRHFKGT